MKRLFTVAMLLTATLGLVQPTLAPIITQQSATTFTGPTQSFTCSGSYCSICNTNTQTITQVSSVYVFSPTTYTVGGTVYTLTSVTSFTFVQTGSTWANTLCMTLTNPTTTEPPPPPPSWWLWVLGAVVVAVAIIVAIELNKKPEPEKQNRKPPPSVKPPLPMPKPVAAQSLDERILSYLEGHHGEISISRASYEIGVTESQLNEALSRLSQKGMIRKDSP